VKLGPHLLEEDDPKLGTVRSRESDSVSLAWNEVINDYAHLNTILIKSGSVNAVIICIVVAEELSDSVRLLCYGRQRRKEITITNLSLLDVIWFDISLEDMHLSILIDKCRDVSGSSPGNWSKLHKIINVVLRVDDAIVNSGKF
jgi:hypothetical protein